MESRIGEIGANNFGSGYMSQCNDGGTVQHLGIYDTPNEAFNVYKEFKEKLIKQVADEYKGLIPKELYEAMYEYEVDIND